jgi:hypothetical protein
VSDAPAPAATPAPAPREARWGRAVLAGLLAEVATIALIVAAVTAYRFSGASGLSVDAFGARAGAVLGPLGGVVFTFLFARWVVRGLRERAVAHGLVVAAGAIALHVAGAVGAHGGYHAVAAAADALKLAAGALAGYLAQRRATA